MIKENVKWLFVTEGIKHRYGYGTDCNTVPSKNSGYWCIIITDTRKLNNYDGTSTNNLNFTGEWSRFTDYKSEPERIDVVMYEGNSYMCCKSHAGLIKQTLEDRQEELIMSQYVNKCEYNDQSNKELVFRIGSILLVIACIIAFILVLK